jgi:alkanesulfonate monooxygenase SsuD/methylene tetrahydromethanopterin reductase-like flavin-dependent oxidoreductase (luciferase family)
MNEMLELLPRLWEGRAVEHAGKFFQFAPVEVPTPPCAPPIYVGGNSDFAIRRAVRAADGWAGIGLREDELREMLERIAAAAKELRAPARRPLQIRTLLKGRVDPDRLAAHAALGIDALILQNWQVTGKKPFEPQSAGEVGKKLAELTALCAV